MITWVITHITGPLATINNLKKRGDFLCWKQEQDIVLKNNLQGPKKSSWKFKDRATNLMGGLEKKMEGVSRKQKGRGGESSPGSQRTVSGALERYQRE